MGDHKIAFTGQGVGPDGFTARFLQVAWSTIRPELMAALDAFWHLDFHDLHGLQNTDTSVSAQIRIQYGYVLDTLSKRIHGVSVKNKYE
jgi:hypothetical protein